MDDPTAYYRSEEFREDARKAIAAFEVTQRDDVFLEIGEGHAPVVTVVEAQAKTGSRYLATCAVVPARSAGIVGGRLVVTLHEPFQSQMVWTAGSHADAYYVADKLMQTRYRQGALHGGDWAAVLLLLREVSSQRIRVLPEELSGE